MPRHIVWREHWRSGSLGGLYKIELLHDGEEYEIVPAAPDDLATIGDRTIMPDGTERLTREHVAIFRYEPGRHQVNALEGEFVGCFHHQYDARKLAAQLQRVAEVMDS